MNKNDKKVGARKWQIIGSNAVGTGCQNYRWELGKVGKELKAIFIENASSKKDSKKDSKNVIDLAEISKKSA